MDVAEFIVDILVHIYNIPLTGYLFDVSLAPLAEIYLQGEQFYDTYHWLEHVLDWSRSTAAYGSEESATVSQAVW